MRPEALWRPSASIAILKARAQLLAAIRAFFMQHGLLEVQTPILSAHATVDRHIDSFATRDGRWLQTSPEFAMKRLIAAGSGPIWQLAPVFRVDEQGRHHNPEFTLLEWYQPGYDHLRLMDEVEALLRNCGAPDCRYERLSYREAFVRHAGFDPFVLSAQQLRAQLGPAGIAEPEQLDAADLADRDFWLDLWMSQHISPRLGQDAPQFLYDFPASQAALARVRDGEPPLAERFELFWRGIELANGFHELSDAQEQRRRFLADQAWRAQQKRMVPPYDAHLVEALAAGFPDCAGVALGVDRLLMLLTGCARLEEVLAFAADRA